VTPRLATRLVIEEALEGEAADAPGRGAFDEFSVEELEALEDWLNAYRSGSVDMPEKRQRLENRLAQYTDRELELAKKHIDGQAVVAGDKVMSRTRGRRGSDGGGMAKNQQMNLLRASANRLSACGRALKPWLW
jgi:hypothetical protein